MSQDYDPNDYNRGGMIAFIFSMVFTFAFFIYVSVIHKGVDLKEIPEEGAEGATQTMAKFDPSSVSEPWVFSEDMAKHGEKVYSTNCALCHGPKFDGNGPAGMALNPKPRNLVDGGWKKGGTTMALMKTLTEGFAPGSSMASFGHLPLNDRWAVVHFIRSITKDKPENDESALKAYAQSLK